MMMTSWRCDGEDVVDAAVLVVIAVALVVAILLAERRGCIAIIVIKVAIIIAIGGRVGR